MITKLTSNDYLKRFSSMTLAEKQEYLEKVMDWNKNQSHALLRHTADTEAQLQNILQCGNKWKTEEQDAISEGIRLLSAFAGNGDSWLPNAVYAKSAKRVIQWIADGLMRVQADNTATPKSIAATQPLPAKKRPGRPKKEARAEGSADTADTAFTPVRPKHIDQYVHLFPKKIQERAGMVKDLLRQEEVARDNARLLMNDPNSSPDDRAKWATLATKCDKAVKDIYRALDEEWDKLVKSGRVVIDDLGNARVVSPEKTEEKTADPEKPTRTKEQSANRRTLRKWLGDTRRGNGKTREEHVRKWKEAYREFLKIEGADAAKDSKIAEAAKHYGIDLASLS